MKQEKNMGRNTMKKEKKQYPEDFRTIFGFSTMTWSVAASTVFITSFFMLYLTDYSGIDASVGQVGFAATFGTILLLIARVVDIIDDPMQALIIDNAKEGRLGKYRKFAFANVFLVTVSMICIFSIPEIVKSNPVLLCIWVGFFYLMYEMGGAFNTSMPLLQKTTYDIKLRTKISQRMRIWLIVILVPVYFYITLVTAVDQYVDNIGKSFSLVSTVMLLIFGVFSFTGVLCLREKPDTTPGNGEGSKEKLKLKEIGKMFIQNKPLLVHTGAMFLSDMVFNLGTVISVYFLKWYYAADLATGAVDAVKYAGIYGLFALTGLLPNFIAPFFAGKLVKKAGSYARATSFCLLLGVAVNAVKAILFFTGILKASPYIFILLNLLGGLALGTAVIPQTLLWAEGADYAEYKTGKKMSAIVNSVNSVLGKAQSALSTVLAGSVLIAVGYSVNNETGNYAGNIAELPRMISGFGIFLTIVPVVVMLAAYLLYRFLYPITPEMQKEMVEELAARREMEGGPAASE